jgi:septal ring factor EnvC (AmiA/AmiB activator)
VSIRPNYDPEATRLDLPASSGGGIPPRYLVGGLVILVVVLAYLIYGFYTLQEGQKTLFMEMQLENRKLQAELAEVQKKIAGNTSSIADLKSDIGVIRQRVGVTQSDLTNARTQVMQLKEQQSQSDVQVAQLNAALSQKAEATQLQALQKDAEQKFGVVTKDVGAVRTDVEETKKNLGDTQRQLVDVRDTLSSQIARNKSELDELRRKGERQYVEFSAEKNKIVAVHDIRVQLRDTDTKKSKYNISILVDDQRLEKKDRSANEPLQFLVGKDKVRYEIVVNTVGKNKVDGYLSVPKDRNLSAERPKGTAENSK